MGFNTLLADARPVEAARTARLLAEDTLSDPRSTEDARLRAKKILDLSLEELTQRIRSSRRQKRSEAAGSATRTAVPEATTGARVLATVLGSNRDVSEGATLAFERAIEDLLHGHDPGHRGYRFDIALTGQDVIFRPFAGPSSVAAMPYSVANHLTWLRNVIAHTRQLDPIATEVIVRAQGDHSPAELLATVGLYQLAIETGRNVPENAPADINAPPY